MTSSPQDQSTGIPGVSMEPNGVELPVEATGHTHPIIPEFLLTDEEQDDECDAATGEDLARELERFPGYRVLRELRPRTTFASAEHIPLLHGVVADIETTGLDPHRAEIIEVAFLPFTFTVDGEVVATRTPYQGLRQPATPLPPAVTRLTGLTDATLSGTCIPPDAIDQFLGSPAIVIAHNAAFDRPFLERLCPRLADMAWACSLTQVDWRGEGAPGSRLNDLAYWHGAFFRTHRALDDCRALLEILARPLPSTGAPALAALLQASRRPTMRVWAVGAAFEARELLRSSGYRWHPGDRGGRRAWAKEVGPDELDSELAFLTSFFFDGHVSPVVEELNAFRRFSTRA